MPMIKSPARAYPQESLIEFLAVLVKDYGRINPDGHTQLMLTKEMHNKLAASYRVLLEVDEEDDESPIFFILEEAPE